MNKVFLISISILIGVLFSGCLSPTKETYISYKSYPKAANVTAKRPLHVDKKIILKEEVSGIIKGKISKLYFDGSKALWGYEVKSSDTSNGKLAYAKFTHKKDVAKIGDVVYVFIKDGKLKEFYLLEKSNYVKKASKKVSKKKKRKKKKFISHKRDKNNQSNINIPSSEIISLD